MVTQVSYYTEHKQAHPLGVFIWLSLSDKYEHKELNAKQLNHLEEEKTTSDIYAVGILCFKLSLSEAKQSKGSFL